MALIILEGLDRTGKSLVAGYFEKQGHEVIHMSAPAKNNTRDSYLDEMMEIVSVAATKDIVLDRSYYGELIWPNVYGRKPLLEEEDIDALREIEDSVGVTKIMMHDSNVEAHWQRCVDNKEPLTKPQFVKARALYSNMALKYGFEQVSLPTFVKRFKLDESFYIGVEQTAVEQVDDTVTVTVNNNATTVVTLNEPKSKKTQQQVMLEKANAINDILEKRILKSKGLLYDELETEIRDFLNTKLGKIFGNCKDESLSKEEIAFFKTMYKRAIEKK